MRQCARCGNQTTWLRRVRADGYDYCSVTCRNLSQIARKAAQTRAARKARAEKRASKEAKARARQEAGQAEEKARLEAANAEADARRKAGEALEREKDAPFDEMLLKAGADAYEVLKVARQAVQQEREGVASKALMRAFALGIPAYKESAQAKWEYAGVRWRSYVGARHESHELEAANPGDLPEEVRHYLSEAEVELKRQVRINPGDLQALSLLRKVTWVLGKSVTAVEEQIKRIEIRQSLLGTGPSEHHEADKAGLSFENRCLEVIRSMGFQAELTKISGDGGIDIIATQSKPLIAGRYIIQCKDWANPVGEPPLRDLLGVVAAEDAIKGILITSGTFTEGARRFAQGKRLELIDGKDIDSITVELRLIRDNQM